MSKKTKTIGLIVTEFEHQALFKQAEAGSMSLSNYVRQQLGLKTRQGFRGRPYGRVGPEFFESVLAGKLTLPEIAEMYGMSLSGVERSFGAYVAKRKPVKREWGPTGTL